MKKKWLVLCTTILVVLGMVLAACGEEATTSDDSTATGGPVSGGTLVMASGDEGGGTIGIPWLIQGNQAVTAIPCVDTLVIAAWDGTVQPNLAASWEIADDKSSVTFEIQPDVLFHDGTACDAEAIAWNLEQWMESGNVGMAHAWESVEVVDDSHVKVNVMGWKSTVLTGFSEAYLGFISPTAYETNGETWAESNLVSTGPFTLAELETGVGWTWEKNPDYWGGEPYLDSIEYKVVKDNNTLQLMMESGEVDIILMNGGEPAVQNALAAQGFDLLGFQEMEETTNLYVDSVNPDSPWASLAVREAVDYAIDRESIAALGSGLWMTTYQFVDPRNELYDASLVREYDPDTARDMLAAAGYPDGFATTIWHGGDDDQAAILQQNLADVGITATVELVDTGAMFGMAMNGWQNGGLIAPFPSKPGFLEGAETWFGMFSPLFVSSYRSQDLQDLIDAGLAADTPEEQATYSKQVLALLFNEVAGYPLTVSEYSIGVKAPYVHDDGYGTGSAGRWTPAKCWLSE